MLGAAILWRRVTKADLDTLRGESRGQYDIRLNKPSDIEAFFDGLPKGPVSPMGGYDIQVPLVGTSSPVPVPETTVTVAFIGDGASRSDWRICSQRPDSAYPLWRLGTGVMTETRPNDAFLVLVRDPDGKFHARWLPAAKVQAFPSPLAEQMGGARNTGIARIAKGWDGVASVLSLASAHEGAVESVVPPPDNVVGEEYRVEDENVKTAQSDPFQVDPSVLDRGILGHRTTQNWLAADLVARGLAPRSHRPGVEPPFDLAWTEGDHLFVVEVKSTTTRNEEKQLRLGLGQVLRYCDLLTAPGITVIPVLFAENEPSDPGWLRLCDSLGVRLSWPEKSPAA